MTWETLLQILVLGLPGDRPGGLALTLLAFFGAATLGLVLGVLYAAACVASTAMSWPLMIISTFIRGVPPILLVFALAHVPGLPLAVAGMLGLALYSFSHAGETLRAYLAAYPRAFAEAARVTGVHPGYDWIVLRLGWTFRHGLPALATHWISLLKDTGALVIVGIGELTTVAKLVAESTANLTTWFTALATAAALYLGATCVLLMAVNRLQKLLDPRIRTDAVGRPRASRGVLSVETMDGSGSS